VVNDAKLAIWNAYGVQSWPTMILIDPQGNVAGKIADEHVYGALDRAIGGLVKRHRQLGTLSNRRLRFQASRGVEHGDGPLFFPGKVLADDIGERLFIADSTHHRIVITTLSGKRIDIVGTGEPGRANGSFDKASFNDPQGMALDGDTLYVADRRNHMIRAIDLKAKTVSTAAGTGYQYTDRQRGGPASRTGLNSPWDLLLNNKVLYIAEAGNHQIWTLNLATKRLMPFAGNGYEDLKDGSLGESNFAQPSGLTTDGTTLYVADSESSSIRALPLDGRGQVRTLVGTGLFNFGDKDGVGPQALLQHALAVQYYDGKLIVADTYNSKLKIIDPAKRLCVSGLGGKSANCEMVFNEPGGLSIAYGKLYVADTNAHRIRVVDLKTNAVSTLELEGVKAPTRQPHVAEVRTKKR
jgi:DNA-binding beta-propeller fold protein YncE